MTVLGVNKRQQAHTSQEFLPRGSKGREENPKAAERIRGLDLASQDRAVKI